MKKALLAGCSLFLSGLTFAQAIPMSPETGNFWIDGKVVTIAYANGGAPGSVSNALMMQVLADAEARLDGLNVPGLQVAIDTNVKNAGCGVRDRNTVVVCWEAISGNTGGFVNGGGMEGTTSWREANIMVDTQTSWNEDALYATIMHQLMHVLGFAHPDGANTSVLNGAADITAVDVAGLQAMYSTRCVLPFDATTRNIVIPFVTYQGGAYKATIHHNGGTSFSLAAVSAWGPGNPPLTPCQNIAVDGNNRFHLPAVNVGGASVWGDFQFQGGVLTLLQSGTN